MTSKETRKGNFAKNNPDYVRNKEQQALVQATATDAQKTKKQPRVKRRQRRKERKLLSAFEGEH